ncbi:MAG: hypothetical protein Q7J16_05395, partial [Candidatus Cloacimonadales bacterium]|nr:hypothetical protein [Candidatus Cloacimonadales bacterium]
MECKISDINAGSIVSIEPDILPDRPDPYCKTITLIVQTNNRLSGRKHKKPWTPRDEKSNCCAGSIVSIEPDILPDRPDPY